MLHCCLPFILGGGPYLILDDGGDATLLIHDKVKSEEEYVKSCRFPDPSSTDNAEFQIVLTIIRGGLKADQKIYHKCWRSMTAHEFVVVAAQAVAEAEPSSPESKQSAGDGGSGIGGKTRLLDLDAKPPSVYSRAISSASIFVLVAFVLSMYLIVEHLAAYDQPEEQKLLIGLILMVPVYALESFLSLLDSNAAFNCQIIRDYSATASFHSPPSVPSTQSTRRAPSPISLGTPVAFASSSCLAAHRPVPGRISSPIAIFSLSSAFVTAPPHPILTSLLISSPPSVRVTPPHWSSAASGFAPVTLS